MDAHNAPRHYEVRKTMKRGGGGQATLGFAETLAGAVAKAETMAEAGYIVRIREYELSGMPGIRPIRPDRLLTPDEARAELGA
jgi:hypothetical protein